MAVAGQCQWGQLERSETETQLLSASGGSIDKATESSLFCSAHLSHGSQAEHVNKHSILHHRISCLYKTEVKV